MDYKVLFQNQFLAVHEREGYTFSHEVRANGHIVAIVPFRRIGDGVEYLARIEICPAHSLEPARYSITGGARENETPVMTAKRELLEESGYDVNASMLVPLGNVRPSKSADTIVHLFTVDVTDLPQETPQGDGSRWEEGASVEWVSYMDGLQIHDPLFVTALVRLGEQIKNAH